MFTVIVLSLVIVGIIIHRAQRRAERESEQLQLQLRLLHY